MGQCTQVSPLQKGFTSPGAVWKVGHQWWETETTPLLWLTGRTTHETSRFNSSAKPEKKKGHEKNKLVPLRWPSAQNGFILEGHFCFILLMRGRMKQSSDMLDMGKCLDWSPVLLLIFPWILPKSPSTPTPLPVSTENTPSFTGRLEMMYQCLQGTQIIEIIIKN